MNTEIKNRSEHLENMISTCSWIPRFMQSQRASRLMLLTEKKAAASSGVLPCWRPSVLSVFARQDNEPKQVINEKCINDWTLYVPKDKTGKENDQIQRVKADQDHPLEASSCFWNQRSEENTVSTEAAKTWSWEITGFTLRLSNANVDQNFKPVCF